WKNYTPNLETLSLRYFRWKIFLGTDHAGYTPTAQSMTVQYNVAPATVAYSSPGNSSSVLPDEIRFDWEDSYDLDGDTVSYNLALSASPDFVSTITVTSALFDSGFDFTSILQKEQTYYWKILIRDSGDFTVVNPLVWRFHVHVPEFEIERVFPSTGQITSGDMENGITLSLSNKLETLLFNPFTLRGEDGEALNTQMEVFVSSLTLRPLGFSFSPFETYALRVPVSISDVYGNHLAEEKNLSFRIFLSTGAVFEYRKENLMILFSSGTIGQPVFSEISEEVLPPFYSDLKPLSRSFFTFALEDLSGTLLETFSPPVQLRLFYPDSDGDGFVDGTEIHEKFLKA
ncbi:MAG TPA: hypothetical protein VJC03_01255, partial [bacterium]|nr:hypothetical protein [bacterium]